MTIVLALMLIPLALCGWNLASLESANNTDLQLKIEGLKEDSSERQMLKKLRTMYAIRACLYLCTTILAIIIL